MKRSGTRGVSAPGSHHRPQLVSRALWLASFVSLVGCYEQHRPWSSAAPDGSGVFLEITLSGTGGGPPYEARVQIEPDGTYVASDRFELRVCTGRLSPALLGDAEALVRETAGFELEGAIGHGCIHCEAVGVELRSEGGEVARFGGVLPHEVLVRYQALAESVLAGVDFEGCAPHRLDPVGTSLQVYPYPGPLLDAVGLDGDDFALLELAEGAPVLELSERAPDGPRSVACEIPLTDGERETLLEEVRVAATDVTPWLDTSFDVGAGARIETSVPISEGRAMPRTVSFGLRRERVDHRRLEAELLELVRMRCR